VIALAVFEETFYRYAKACERKEGWDQLSGMARLDQQNSSESPMSAPGGRRHASGQQGDGF
jgi:hypothetical protein